MKKIWHRKQVSKPKDIKSNGLYNEIQSSPLTDTPCVGPELLEVIRDYIRKYKESKGRHPSYNHLNRQFSIRATKEYYLTIG
jgi:hypothetical protein